ncbi:MAG TPA: hypothetical protein VIH18_31615 [Candidatus Binatia bacterium]|jgi:hypothetical protein
MDTRVSHGRGVSGTNDLIQRLLKHAESDALEIVAILLLGGAPLAEETEMIIREQVLAKLSSRSENEAVTELFLLGLTFLQPNIVEFSAWHEPQDIRLIWHRREWVVSRIMDRFNDERERHHLIITSGFQNKTPALDYRALYQRLEPFILQRGDFPTVIATAAIEVSHAAL